MRACLALCVASALVGAALASCPACIGGQCYRQQPLPFIPKMVPMDIDRNSNTIYSGDYYKSWQCHLDDGQCQINGQPWNIKWLTVDQRTGDTYGRVNDMGENCLYKLHLNNNTADVLLRGSVNHLIYKDKPYFSTFERGIYTLEDGEPRIVPATEEYDVNQLVVDKNGDIYFKAFLNTKYLTLRLSKGFVDHKVYWKEPCYISLDKDDNVIFIKQDIHIVYRVSRDQLTEIGIINDDIYDSYSLESPLFDRDNNIIYRRDSGDFQILKRDANSYCSYSVSNNTVVVTETDIPLIIEATSSSPEGATINETAGQNDTGAEQDSCECPKLENITIKLKFN